MEAEKNIVTANKNRTVHVMLHELEIISISHASRFEIVSAENVHFMQMTYFLCERYLITLPRYI